MRLSTPWDGSPVAELRPPGGAAKRLLDVTFSACGLIALAPVIGVIAAAVRVTMGSPVLFRQPRPGYMGEPFQLVKFRTMHEGSDEHGRPLPANLRVTRLGAFLRTTSLDELPELWNILKGEMSIVGPRPLLMEYLPRYTPEQARRHEAKPGLTGLAQVSGRHLLEWQRRFDLDLWYVDHWSMRLDALIILRTIGKVLRREGLPPPTADDYLFLGTDEERRLVAGTPAEPGSR
jgi:sugar transferase EpsL